jgi:hypothetical protein
LVALQTTRSEDTRHLVGERDHQEQDRPAHQGRLVRAGPHAVDEAARDLGCRELKSGAPQQ